MTRSVFSIASVFFVAGVGIGFLVFSLSRNLVSESASGLAEPDAPGTLAALADSPAPPESAPPSPPTLAQRQDNPPVEADTDLRERIAALVASSARMQSQLGAVTRRLEQLERAQMSSDIERQDTRPPRPRTPQERSAVLIEAGVPRALAEDILWEESDLALSRLELRDQAVREGWMGEERYREELRALNERDVPLRERVGDERYDRYLYLAGRDNRVSVTAAFSGSAAEQGGVEPEDLIEAYAGERVFNYADLRRATSEGERGELVQMRIRRGGQLIDLWVPRGPLGVQLDRRRVAPSRP